MISTRKTSLMQNARFKVMCIAMFAALSTVSCTGEESPEEDVSSDPGPVSDTTVNDLADDFRSLERSVLSDQSLDFPRPVAAETGIQGGSGDSPEITVEVYKVEARDDSTFVSWGVRAAEGSFECTELWINLSGGDLSIGDDPPFNVWDHARRSATMAQLFDSATETTYWPLQRQVGQDDNFKGCLCSGGPEYLTEVPYVINGLYPKLPDSLETISFKIPDFPVIHGIPVVRS